MKHPKKLALATFAILATGGIALLPKASENQTQPTPATSYLNQQPHTSGLGMVNETIETEGNVPGLDGDAELGDEREIASDQLTLLGNTGVEMLALAQQGTGEALESYGQLFEQLETEELQIAAAELLVASIDAKGLWPLIQSPKFDGDTWLSWGIQSAISVLVDSELLAEIDTNLSSATGDERDRLLQVIAISSGDGALAYLGEMIETASPEKVASQPERFASIYDALLNNGGKDAVGLLLRKASHLGASVTEEMTSEIISNGSDVQALASSFLQSEDIENLDGLGVIKALELLIGENAGDERQQLLLEVALHHPNPEASQLAKSILGMELEPETDVLEL